MALFGGYSSRENLFLQLVEDQRAWARGFRTSVLSGIEASALSSPSDGGGVIIEFSRLVVVENGASPSRAARGDLASFSR